MTNRLVQEPEDDMPDEYDEATLRQMLANGVRGKYAGQTKRRSNIARLAPDVSEAFPTDNELNEALRSLIQNRKPQG
jgi:hypothetical protein